MGKFHEFGPFWLDIGWYPGDPWVLVKVELCSTFTNFRDFALFQIQVLKFAVGFGWNV